MQYQILTLSALAATAFAQLPTGSYDTLSVLGVLETALPSSLVAEALTNPGAVSSELASDFSAGQTPTWYSALPSDIKTIIVPASSNAAAASNSLHTIPASGSVPTIVGTGVGPVITPAGNGTYSNGTYTSGTLVVTSSGASGASGLAGPSSTTRGTSSSGSGAAPTAVFGLGLAGAAGLVGLLAL